MYAPGGGKTLGTLMIKDDAPATHWSPIFLDLCGENDYKIQLLEQYLLQFYFGPKFNQQVGSLEP